MQQVTTFVDKQEHVEQIEKYRKTLTEFSGIMLQLQRADVKNNIEIQAYKQKCEQLHKRIKQLEQKLESAQISAPKVGALEPDDFFAQFNKEYLATHPVTPEELAQWKREAIARIDNDYKY